MNRIESKFKIQEISYYLLGKTVFKRCVKQESATKIFKEFCNSWKHSDAFQLKYCNGLTAEEIAECLGYDVRTIYKQIDRDMAIFGRWLSHDCSEAPIFEQIRIGLENAIFSEYKQRHISTTDRKSWETLRSDCLKTLL